MRNVWLVARHEYGRIAGRRAFILLSLAVPLGFVLLVAVIVFVERSGESNLPLGYVDHAGFLPETVQSMDEFQSGVIAFGDKFEAMEALENGEIQGYYSFPTDYLETLETDLYFLENSPAGDKRREFVDFVRANLVRELPQDLQQRLLEGAEVHVIDVVNGREFSGNDINLIIPFVAALLFFIATMTASGYMLQIVADEKENRTMELLLTSMTPGELISGKVAGLLAVIMTQLGIYFLAAGIGFGITSQLVGGAQNVVIPWSFLGVVALFFLPSFFLIASAMAALGSAVTNLQQGQQVAGILNMLFIAPLFFIVFIFQDPGGPFVVFLSLFPTTAFMTIALRWGLGSVPIWQIVVSWILLMATAVFMMWTAIRVFRAGMLRYGQPLSLRASLKAIRGS